VAAESDRKALSRIYTSLTVVNRPRLGALPRIHRGFIAFCFYLARLPTRLKNENRDESLAMPNGPDNKENAPDQSVFLHYIDKLFATSNALSATAHRSILVATVLSLILLGLSGGAISAQEKITYQGVGLRVPLAVFLTGGAIAVTTLIVESAVIQSQRIRYRAEIVRLYRDLGFDDRTLDDRVIHPFRRLQLRPKIQKKTSSVQPGGGVWGRTDITVVPGPTCSGPSCNRGAGI
jgi:hypothetical protein